MIIKKKIPLYNYFDLIKSIKSSVDKVRNNLKFVLLVILSKHHCFLLIFILIIIIIILALIFIMILNSLILILDASYFLNYRLLNFLFTILNFIPFVLVLDYFFPPLFLIVIPIIQESFNFLFLIFLHLFYPDSHWIIFPLVLTDFFLPIQ